MQMAFLQSGCLYVVTKLEVADVLADGDKSAEEIAAATNADPDYLYRVMRYLAGQGLFEEKPGRMFGLTAMSELLRVDAEGSFHPFTLINSEWGFEAVLELLSGVKEGRIPFEKRSLARNRWVSECLRFRRHPDVCGYRRRSRRRAGRLSATQPRPIRRAVRNSPRCDAVR